MVIQSNERIEYSYIGPADFFPEDFDFSLFD